MYLRFLLLFFLIQHNCFAQSVQSTRFKLKYASILLELPKKWTSVQKLYGMPLMIIGAEDKGNKPVLSITSTNIKNMKSPKQITKQAREVYYSGRKSWLAKRKGDLIKFLAYEKEEIAPKVSSHSIGVVYDIGKRRVSERTYYVTCNKQLFHLKTISNFNRPKESLALKKLIKSFKCI